MLPGGTAPTTVVTDTQSVRRSSSLRSAAEESSHPNSFYSSWFLQSRFVRGRLCPQHYRARLRISPPRRATPCTAASYSFYITCN
jgi:hypothetical protein